MMILSSPSSRQAKGFAVLAGSNVLARAFGNACPLDHRATIHAYFPGKRIVFFWKERGGRKKCEIAKRTQFLLQVPINQKETKKFFSIQL
ncbi:MAG TPA: hypothetical protein VNU95_09370 [Candidatus Acidoferrales bacterium]|jgi:hypothetical protein|nr:hypothetical protein [Candidatus Acidoferrales bacterium]